MNHWFITMYIEVFLPRKGTGAILEPEIMIQLTVLESKMTLISNASLSSPKLLK